MTRRYIFCASKLVYPAGKLRRGSSSVVSAAETGKKRRFLRLARFGGLVGVVREDLRSSRESLFSQIVYLTSHLDWEKRLNLDGRKSTILSPAGRNSSSPSRGRDHLRAEWKR